MNKEYIPTEEDERDIRKRFRIGLAFGGALLAGALAYDYGLSNREKPGQEFKVPADTHVSFKEVLAKDKNLERKVEVALVPVDRFELAKHEALDRQTYLEQLVFFSDLGKKALEDGVLKGVYYNPSSSDVKTFTEPLLRKKFKDDSILKTFSENSVNFYKDLSERYPLVFLPGFEDIFLEKIPVNLLFTPTSFNNSYIHSDADLENYFNLVLREQMYRSNGISQEGISINSQTVSEGKFSKDFAKGVILLSARRDLVQDYLVKRSKNEDSLSFENVEWMLSDYSYLVDQIPRLDVKTDSEKAYFGSLNESLSKTRVSKSLDGILSVNYFIDNLPKFFELRKNSENTKEEF